MPQKATSSSFQPGRSGNPGGRPKAQHDLQELCRNLTPKALQALEAALEVPKERARAAEILLAYGYGRPVQTMHVRKITCFEDLSDEELLVLAGAANEEPPGARH